VVGVRGGGAGGAPRPPPPPPPPPRPPPPPPPHGWIADRKRRDLGLVALTATVSLMDIVAIVRWPG